MSSFLPGSHRDGHSSTLRSHLNPADIDDLPEGDNPSFPDDGLLEQYKPEVIIRMPHVEAREGRLTFITASNLVVKWTQAEEQTVADCQCPLYARRHLEPHRVPIPKTYGWRTWNGYRFLYMELVRGKSLGQIMREEGLSLAQMKQRSPWKELLETIEQYKEAWYRYVPYKVAPRNPPRENVDHIYNKVNVPRDHRDKSIEERFRLRLPGFPYRFAHADMDPDNIMVDEDRNGNPYVTGIIDWGHAAWYSDYRRKDRTE
ncbi:MAG: hypothetical protein Q9162_007800 [Coniocarpon cinnabarinum]